MSCDPPHEVPSATLLRLKPRTHDFCVIVFVVNEGEKIRKQLERMTSLTDTIDVVVADGGSTDGSLAEDHLRRCGVTALLTKVGPGRLSAQMRVAFDFALTEGYLGVVTIDGNGKDGVDAIPDFMRLLENGADHVQGSRFIPGGRAVNTPVSRYLGVRILHAPLISLAARHRHTDTTNGFRGYSRRLLADPEIAVFREIFTTYELHYHLAIEAGRLKRFVMAETPVTRSYPRGKVPTKIKGVRGNLHVLGVLFRAVAGRYRFRCDGGSQ